MDDAIERLSYIRGKFVLELQAILRDLVEAYINL
jgi:hypothetical protein